MGAPIKYHRVHGAPNYWIYFLDVPGGLGNLLLRKDVSLATHILRL